MPESKANQLAEMLKAGTVELTVNGVVLGKAKVVKSSRHDLEVYPPIERVEMTLQFINE